MKNLSLVSCLLLALNFLVSFKKTNQNSKLVQTLHGVRIYTNHYINQSSIDLYKNIYNSNGPIIYLSSVNSAIQYQAGKSNLYNIYGFTGKGNSKKGTLSINEIEFIGAQQSTPNYDININVNSNADKINTFKSYFGKEIEIALKDGSNAIVNFKGYEPKEIGIQEPIITKDMDHQPYCDKETGITLKWNADSENQMGIAIVLFDPKDADAPELIYVTEDDGEDFISPNMISNFKKNHVISMTIYRANGGQFDGTDGNKYTIACYSKCMGALSIK